MSEPVWVYYTLEICMKLNIMQERLEAKNWFMNTLKFLKYKYCCISSDVCAPHDVNAWLIRLAPSDLPSI